MKSSWIRMHSLFIKEVTVTVVPIMQILFFLLLLIQKKADCLLIPKAHRQLALADVNAAHPLVTDAEDALGIGDHHQLRRDGAGLPEECVEVLLVRRGQIHPS